MSKYRSKKKKNFRRLLSSPITLICLIVLAVIIGRSSWRVSQKTISSSSEVDDAKAELARLVDRKQLLAQSVAYLDTDAGVEGEIRSKYRVAKPGESIAMLVEAENKGTTSTTTSAETGLWTRILQFVGIR